MSKSISFQEKDWSVGQMLEAIAQGMPNRLDVISDTVSHNGNWNAISCFDSITFKDSSQTIVVGNSGVNMSALNGKIPNGYILTANFTRITLNSGVAIAHRRS